jgi:predicted aldo/keto reductase-like oxidoreductase
MLTIIFIKPGIAGKKDITDKCLWTKCASAGRIYTSAGRVSARCLFSAYPWRALLRLLHKALEAGIDFYDTARYYSNSEEKLGKAFSHRRAEITIATKAMVTGRTALLDSLETSLKNMQTDYVDILQLHNPAELPDTVDPESSYAGLLEARKKGMARFIGLTCHKRENALKAAASGDYDTLQFPLSCLSSEEDLTVIAECQKHDCGLIAMKALSGGLITNAATAFAFLRQYDNVLPIWGIQRDEELSEFIAFEKQPPVLDKNLWNIIERDRASLSGQFCRGCGYCMPCPAGIEISWAARMKLLLRRAPFQNFLTDEWRRKMDAINECTQCGQCRKQCPYGLDTPQLLKINLEDYNAFYREHGFKTT